MVREPAPLDRTNPGKNTTLTSYASNAALFGLQDGGSARYPKDFNKRGTSNAVISWNVSPSWDPIERGTRGTVAANWTTTSIRR
jgi:hypothetical protein